MFALGSSGHAAEESPSTRESLVQEPTKIGLPELRDARLQLPGSRRAAPDASAARFASQQAIRGLLESNLTSAGFDLDRYQQLIKWSDAESRLRIASLKAEADKQSPAVLEDLTRTVEQLTDRLEHLKDLAAADTPAEYFLLDTATEISATPEIHLDATHIGPKPDYNWAKFLQNVSRGGGGFHAGSDTVSFGFLWQNPRDSFAIVKVHGYLVLNGFCSVFADGDVFSHSSSSLSVEAGLFTHELWNDPPTVPVPQPFSTQVALEISCDSLGLFTSGESASESLYRGFDLEYSDLVFPPKGIAMFEVACRLFRTITEGQVQSDFSFADRQVLCPAVFVGVL